MSDALAEAGCADMPAREPPTLDPEGLVVPARPPLPNLQRRVEPMAGHAPVSGLVAEGANNLVLNQSRPAGLVPGPDLPRIAQSQLRPADAIDLPWLKSAQRRRSKARVIGLMAWMATAAVTGGMIAAAATLLSGPPPSQSDSQVQSGTRG